MEIQKHKEHEKTFAIDQTHDGQLLPAGVKEEEDRGGSEQGHKLKLFNQNHDDWVDAADDLPANANVSMNNWFITHG